MSASLYERDFYAWANELAALHLVDNPSLKPRLPEAIVQAYGNAVIEAAAEAERPEETFPPVCPWSFDQLMDERFWP